MIFIHGGMYRFYWREETIIKPGQEKIKKIDNWREPGQSHQINKSYIFPAILRNLWRICLSHLNLPLH